MILITVQSNDDYQPSIYMTDTVSSNWSNDKLYLGDIRKCTGLIPIIISTNYIIINNGTKSSNNDYATTNSTTYEKSKYIRI